MVSTAQRFSLPQAFVEFHLELETQRRLVASGRLGAPAERAAPGDGTTSSTAASSDPAVVLRALFERQAAAARKAGLGGELHEAQYAMAVQADEVFTTLPWPGRDAWEANPLELQLYGATTDGKVIGPNEVYRRIDELLSIPAASDRADLGKVYLLLLSMGFRGRYEGNEETTHIERYRKDLYAWIYGRDAEASPAAERLFEEAYAHTIDKGKPTFLRGLRPWVLALVAALLLLLAASQVIWNTTTNGVEKALERIGQAP